MAGFTNFWKIIKWREHHNGSNSNWKRMGWAWHFMAWMYTSELWFLGWMELFTVILLWACNCKLMQGDVSVFLFELGKIVSCRTCVLSKLIASCLKGKSQEARWQEIIKPDYTRGFSSLSFQSRLYSKGIKLWGIHWAEKISSNLWCPRSCILNVNPSNWQSEAKHSFLSHCFISLMARCRKNLAPICLTWF